MLKEYNDISLLGRNTFGIDAAASRLVEYDGADDLREIAAAGVFAGKWKVIAGGSNMLFTRDFGGTLLHPVSHGVNVVGEQGDKVRVRVAAGTPWADFTAWCEQEGLWGVENLSGIPGLTGSAPVQNIGAYGVEAGHTVAAVHTFLPENGSQLTIAGDHCNFGYRMSIFKGYLKNKAIVTEVDFDLSRSSAPNTEYGDLGRMVEELGGPTLANIRRAVVTIRDSKLPNPKVTGNAGSFFKNPVVEAAAAERLKEEHPEIPLYPTSEKGMVKLAAGWLIDRCGWKGRRLGNAGVHARQALVLVNLGGATGKEIENLARNIIADVREKFGITLNPEVEII